MTEKSALASKCFIQQKGKQIQTIHQSKQQARLICGENTNDEKGKKDSKNQRISTIKKHAQPTRLVMLTAEKQDETLHCGSDWVRFIACVLCVGMCD